MAMKTQPTQVTTTARADWMKQKVQATKQFQALGPCVNASGQRREFAYGTDDHEVVVDAVNKGTPAVTFTSTDAFFKAHLGHALTHIGWMSGPSGRADGWFCQKDDAVNFDTVS